MNTSMIQDYFLSKRKLHGRIYDILEKSTEVVDCEGYDLYNIRDLQQSEEYLIVDTMYQEPWEDYQEYKSFIFLNSLFDGDYVKKEEITLTKSILERTLVGLDEKLLEKLTDLNVDVSRLKDYSYRNQIINKLMED